MNPLLNYDELNNVYIDKGLVDANENSESEEELKYDHIEDTNKRNQILDDTVVKRDITVLLASKRYIF